MRRCSDHLATRQPVATLAKETLPNQIERPLQVVVHRHQFVFLIEDPANERVKVIAVHHLNVSHITLGAFDDLVETVVRTRRMVGWQQGRMMVGFPCRSPLASTSLTPAATRW